MGLAQRADSAFARQRPVLAARFARHEADKSGLDRSMGHADSQYFKHRQNLADDERTTRRQGVRRRRSEARLVEG